MLVYAVLALVVGVGQICGYVLQMYGQIGWEFLPTVAMSWAHELANASVLPVLVLVWFRREAIRGEFRR